LRDGVRYLPTRGRFKIYIVDEVHMLSKGAFNALLKTLEEPPAHVKFIFATTEVNKIPETILSRIQRFDFKRIPARNVIGRLRQICEAEGVQISDESLRLVALAGEGSMRDAQSLLDQVISFGGNAPTDVQVADILGMVDRELLYGFLNGLLTGNAVQALDVIAKVHENGYELSQLTSELLEMLRNAALVALSEGAARQLDVPEEEKKRLSKMVEGISAEQLARTFHVLLEVHDQVARSSRPRYVLEMAVTRLVTLRAAQPVGQLVERLIELERKLKAGGVAPRPAARPRESQDNPEGERRKP
jgi:DNA polymerase-3 subunit gamma/tau